MVVALLCFATTTMMMVSFAGSWRTLLAARILSGVGCGGIVTVFSGRCRGPLSLRSSGTSHGKNVRRDSGGYRIRLDPGPILNRLIGWRNEFRVLACGCFLAAMFIMRSSKSATEVTSRLSSFEQVIREYLVVLDTPRGGRTLAFIFCNGAFHGGIFAWLSLLLISRYHLHDTGIGLALAGYGLPGIFFGAVIGRWGDRYGRS